MLDYLLNVSYDSYITFLWYYLAVGILMVGYMCYAGEMALSSKVEIKDKGPMVPKRAAWIIMEIPVLIAVLYFYFVSGGEFNLAFLIMLPYVIHYTNRALIYPYRINTKGKKMAVGVMLSSMIFYTMKGYLLGYYFGNFAEYDITWLSDPRFIIGLILFVVGFYINIQSDNILINLRKPGETGYKIPKGGCYKWVSCPNYLGEIIEWIGFAIMTWSLVGATLAIWAGGPLIGQAIGAHKWYREKFEEYPKERKAIIPYLL